jgi:hypothetical protein
VEDFTEVAGIIYQALLAGQAAYEGYMDEVRFWSAALVWNDG